MNGSLRNASPIVGIAAAAVVLLGVSGCGIVTPVVDVQIHNDTQREVVVAGCGSDPITVMTGMTEPVEVDAKPRAVDCEIYSARTEYLGCLIARQGEVTLVSGFDSSVRVGDCA